MKTYKKIDIYWYGDYICSTNQSKTCKEAVRRYIETLQNNKHSLGGLSLLQGRILYLPEGLKGRFDKSR